MQPILYNPEVMARIRAEAHRERTRAINRLVFAPIAAFFRRPKQAAARTKDATALTAACG
jgi:hypothetical protein